MEIMHFVIKSLSHGVVVRFLKQLRAFLVSVMPNYGIVLSDQVLRMDFENIFLVSKGN